MGNAENDYGKQDVSGNAALNVHLSTTKQHPSS